MVTHVSKRYGVVKKVKVKDKNGEVVTKSKMQNFALPAQ